MQGRRVVPDAGDDRTDRAPGDPHQRGDRGLGCLRGQPRDLVIEEVGRSGLVPGPGHGSDRDAVLTARDPMSVALEDDLDRAGIQVPPPPPTIATVIARAAPFTEPASVPGRFRRPNRHDPNAGLVIEIDVLDESLFDTEQSPP